MEVHSDGYRYGVQSDQNLPYVFEKVVDILTTKRLVQRESSQGAPEHLIEVNSDLARALMTNPVFRHKIATHDLLSYAMTDALQYFKTITTEQLQHGDMMAPGSVLPEAAADLIAKTFFDFVLKHNLGDTLASMSPEQIQVIALFLSYLQRKPPKHVHISERLDLIRKKPAYTPVQEIISPEIPHFVRLDTEQAGAAEHVQTSRPTMQAPVT